jgi:very-short-patch-repair endonuclease
MESPIFITEEEMKSKTTLRRILLARAREMRRNPTPGEETLWRRLRARRLAGLKFRRQHVISPYIADFYCAAARLVVEIDGASHDGRKRWDTHRDDQLQYYNECEVVRFTEDDVLSETQWVLDEIKAAALRRISELADD